MIDSYEDGRIKEIREKEIPAAIAAIFTSKKFIKLTNIEKRSIDNLIEYITSTNKPIASRSNKIGAIQRKLEKQMKSFSYSGMSEIEKALDSYLEHRKDLDWQTKHDIVNDISNNAAKALVKYAREYITALKEIERLENSKKNSEKARLEAEAKEREELAKQQAKERAARERITSPPSYDQYSYEHSYGSAYDSKEEIQKTTKKPVPRFIQSDEIQTIRENAEKAIGLLEKETLYENSNYHMTRVYLNQEERDILSALLPDSYIYELEEYIEQSYTMKNILTRFSYYEKNKLNPLRKDSYEPKLDDLLEFAECVVNLLPEELTNTNKYTQEGTFKSMISNKTGIKYSIENYKKVYEIYTKYFNKLKPEEQKRIKDKYNNGTRTYTNSTLNIEGFEIPRPDKIQQLVNNKVSKILVKRYDVYSKDNTATGYSEVKRATAYMSIEEIARIYIQSDKEASYIPYGLDERDKESQERFYDDLKTRRGNIERLYANVIKDKLSEEIKKNKSDKEIYKYICETYLHTEMLFEVYEEKKEIPTPKKEGDGITTEKYRINEHGQKEYVYHDGEKFKTTTNKAVAASNYARNRYWGMNKVQQTMATITGKWSKFEQLYNQALNIDEPTEELVEELNNMFVRR